MIPASTFKEQTINIASISWGNFHIEFLAVFFDHEEIKAQRVNRNLVLWDKQKV